MRYGSEGSRQGKGGWAEAEELRGGERPPGVASALQNEVPTSGSYR